MFLFVCNETAYLLNETRWAISSLAAYEPDTPVRLVLFDSTGRYDAQIMGWHPNLTISHFKPSVPIDRDKPGYFFSYKALVFEEALQSTDQDIIFLDGDIIVRDRLMPIFDAMGTADMAIRYRPSIDLVGPMGSVGAARFNAGVIALRNSPRTKAYMSKVRALIIEHLNADGAAQSSGAAITGIDQEALWIAFEDMGDEIALYPLPDRYNDSYFWPDAALWHAKGTARQHPIYLAAAKSLSPGLFGAAFGRLLLGLRLSKRGRLAGRAAMAREQLRGAAFALSGEEIASAVGRVNGGALVSFSSDFLLANPELQKSAKSTACFDWDPTAFHANQAELAHAGVVHEFCLTPAAVDLSSADLVLSDTDQVALAPNVIARVLTTEQRFQDTNTLLRLMRARARQA